MRENEKKKRRKSNKKRVEHDRNAPQMEDGGWQSRWATKTNSDSDQMRFN